MKLWFNKIIKTDKRYGFGTSFFMWVEKDRNFPLEDWIEKYITPIYKKLFK